MSNSYPPAWTAIKWNDPSAPILSCVWVCSSIARSSHIAVPLPPYQAIPLSLYAPVDDNARSWDSTKSPSSSHGLLSAHPSYWYLCVTPSALHARRSICSPIHLGTATTSISHLNTWVTLLSLLIFLRGDSKCTASKQSEFGTQISSYFTEWSNTQFRFALAFGLFTRMTFTMLRDHWSLAIAWVNLLGQSEFVPCSISCSALLRFLARCTTF